MKNYISVGSERFIRIEGSYGYIYGTRNSWVFVGNHPYGGCARISKKKALSYLDGSGLS